MLLESVLLKMGGHISESVFKNWDRVLLQTGAQDRQSQKEILVTIDKDAEELLPATAIEGWPGTVLDQLTDRSGSDGSSRICCARTIAAFAKRIARMWCSCWTSPLQTSTIRPELSYSTASTSWGIGARSGVHHPQSSHDQTGMAGGNLCGQERRPRLQHGRAAVQCKRTHVTLTVIKEVRSNVPRSDYLFPARAGRSGLLAQPARNGDRRRDGGREERFLHAYDPSSPCSERKRE